jgi:succinate-semialdehyde dehydrogenase/glutarate-semialdehyde dehydrogenase
MATQQMGKTYTSSLGEVEKCASAFSHYAEHGPAMLDPKPTSCPPAAQL